MHLISEELARLRRGELLREACEARLAAQLDRASHDAPGFLRRAVRRRR